LFAPLGSFQKIAMQMKNKMIAKTKGKHGEHHRRKKKGQSGARAL